MCNYENIQKKFLDDELYENLFFELGLNIVTTRDSSFIIFNLFNTKYNLVLKPYSCFQLFYILNKILFMHFFGIHCEALFWVVLLCDLDLNLGLFFCYRLY
jgi:hypothetical protein